ncbi:hypothetical protein BDY17DRAFT_346355 [Neohortaea acidophila]|uniref:Uncharacterized protein n=1 Tax=Neohortaea acidophila TaxID=245834 RepID=A0A6A6PQ43_9PEZI|nr:uncharacterized protein BDY17DRAFT_346355 [Neohortaea acidophila]KAF2482240.1 hypothetical protein BDY17DRAFT_346355 [Neohortaea acidophila]
MQVRVRRTQTCHPLSASIQPRDEVPNADSMQPFPNDVRADMADSKKMRRRHSVACLFPPELIEMVIKDIPILDLMIAATEFPSTWRAPEEEDPIFQHQRRINTRMYPEKPPSPRLPAAPKPLIKAYQSCAFKTIFPGMGTLYIHRRHSDTITETKTSTTAYSTTTTTIITITTATRPAEGFFFRPTGSSSSIRVLDPTSKSIQYNAHPTWGCGFVYLRDFDGRLWVRKTIDSRQQGELLFKYIVTFYGGENCDNWGLLCRD